MAKRAKKPKTKADLESLFPELQLVLEGCPDYDAFCVVSFCHTFGFDKRAVIQMMKERCLLPNNTRH